jgi:hypothetical protein
MEYAAGPVWLTAFLTAGSCRLSTVVSADRWSEARRGAGAQGERSGWERRLCPTNVLAGHEMQTMESDDAGVSLLGDQDAGSITHRTDDILAAGILRKASSVAVGAGHLGHRKSSFRRINLTGKASVRRIAGTSDVALSTSGERPRLAVQVRLRGGSARRARTRRRRQPRRQTARRGSATSWWHARGACGGRAHSSPSLPCCCACQAPQHSP